MADDNKTPKTDLETNENLQETTASNPHGEEGRVFLDGAPRAKYELPDSELPAHNARGYRGVPGEDAGDPEAPHLSPDAVADKPI